MTNCVEIKYLEEMGRGLFVPKDIKPGKIIIIIISININTKTICNFLPATCYYL